MPTQTAKAKPAEAPQSRPETRRRQGRQQRAQALRTSNSCATSVFGLWPILVCRPQWLPRTHGRDAWRPV